MKNQELFDRTIGILVNAYFKGILTHGDPCGCAIGNLILGNNQCIKYIGGGKMESKWQYETGEIKSIPYWAWYQVYGEKIHNADERGLKELQSTGYNFYQTCAIEKAFESAEVRSNIDGGFNGLMSVCDALMQVHEATEEEISQAKRLFVKEPA